MKKELFSIEVQYQLFLKTRGLSEEQMSPRQIELVKHTFYGAFTQSLLLFRDEIPNDIDLGAELLHNMIVEGITFFDKLIEKRNNIN